MLYYVRRSYEEGLAAFGYARERVAGMSGYAKTLYEGLQTLLWDPKEPNLLASFYAHPLVQDLHVADKKPSYIEPRTFSLVILDLLVPSDPGASRTMASVREAVAKLPADSSSRKTMSIWELRWAFSISNARRKLQEQGSRS